MKKLLAIFLVLGMAALVLPGCPDDSDDSNDFNGIDVSLARNIDKQFGPVDTSTTGLGVAGNHQANELKGIANNGVLVSAVRLIEDGWMFDSDYQGDWQVPNKGLGGKLQTLAAAAAGSVDNNPCENDADQDGTPDVAEDDCDPVTDPGCTGLCFNSEAVKCTAAGNSFTVKFTDCVADTSTVAWRATSATWTTTGTWTSVWCSTTGSSPTATTTRSIRTSWTTSGKLVPTWVGTWWVNTACSDASFHPQGIDVTFSQVVNCTSSTTWSATWITTWTTYSMDTTWTTADALYNGSATLRYGFGGPDEQVFLTNYNNLTKVWDIDGTGSQDTNPYVSISGLSLEYQVITPWGAQADGTGCSGNSPCNNDGMMINRLNYRRDMDGNDGAVFPTGRYAIAYGDDNEDGEFIISGSGGVVMLKDKQGGSGVALVGEEIDGDPIFAISLYDRDVLPDQMCQNPENEACWVRVSIDAQTRTFDVLEVVNCPNLGFAAGDVGIAY